MAGLKEENKWENNIYRIEESDPVVGGEDGVSNKPQKQLANRTLWLKTKIEELFNKGKPKKITKTTTNLVANDGHTHEIDKASLTVSGIVQLTDSINQDSSVFAATAKAVKTAYDKGNSAYSLAGTKANSSTNITAGNGLTGGGNLTSSRTIALGTPSSITAASTNTATSTSHTHAIDKASLEVAGIVQLTDSINQDSSVFAATAKAVKTAYDKGNSAYSLAGTKANSSTNISAGNGLTGGGNLTSNRTLALGTPSSITAASTNAVTSTSHSHEIDKASLTVSGIVQLTDSINQDSSVFAATAKAVKTAYDKGNSAYSLAGTKANSSTNISAGNGLTGGGNLTSNRTLALGTPSSITAASTNAVTSTSHSHEIDKASLTVSGIVQLTDSINQDSSVFAATAKAVKTAYDKGNSAYSLAGTKANSSTNISAGNGLTGGGNLTSNRTLALGTPSSITAASTNAVTSTSHSHEIDKASLTVSGIVQLTDSINQDSSAFAATAKAVKTAYDKAMTANNNANTRVSKSGDVINWLTVQNNSSWITIKSTNNSTSGIDLVTSNGKYPQVSLQAVDVGGYAENLYIYMTPPGNDYNSDRRQHVMTINHDGNIWSRYLGWLGDRFMDKTKAYDHWYPSHYRGAQVFKIPTRGDGSGLKVIVMQADINGDTELWLPERIEGFFIPIAVDIGNGRFDLGITGLSDNKVKVFVSGRIIVQIHIIGWGD